ncbi:hypothetical protein [Quadrisphaera sp. DSM 44207]|uniref:hypothetical protein n=1 Tax=Quadrisphaera sp. DSM 44207 TaxID=1881057 RepID=UPI00088574F7|nr:hypothetical protein [Quadrisphaera sp. DSM 44207]SDQ05351.1 hypothetical protein SAMN05428996_0220 [Quadrisphaera sp. DSM 44207]
MEEPPGPADRRHLRPVAQPALFPPPQDDGAHEGAADGSPDGGDLPLWHVTVTFAGPATDREHLRESLRELVDAQPFLASVRYTDDRAEVTYWDEAEDVDDAAALGLRLWAEHRRVADLPDWRPVGIEVVDRETLHARGQALPPLTGLGEIRPW